MKYVEVIMSIKDEGEFFMKVLQKNEFLQKSNETLASILDMLEKLPVVKLMKLRPIKPFWLLLT